MDSALSGSLPAVRPEPFEYPETSASPQTGARLPSSEAVYTDATGARALSTQDAEAFWTEGVDARSCVDVPGVGKTQAIVAWPKSWHHAWTDGLGNVWVDGALLGPLTAEERLLQAAHMNGLRSDAEELHATFVAGGLASSPKRPTNHLGRESADGDFPTALRSQIHGEECEGRFIRLLFAARRHADASLYRGFGGYVQCERCQATACLSGDFNPESFPHKADCVVRNVLDAIADIQALADVANEGGAQ